MSEIGIGLAEGLNCHLRIFKPSLLFQLTKLINISKIRNVPLIAGYKCIWNNGTLDHLLIEKSHIVAFKMTMVSLPCKL